MRTTKHVYLTMLALGSVGGLAFVGCSETGDTSLSNADSEVANAASALSSDVEAAVKDSYIVVFKASEVSSTEVSATAAQLASTHGGKVTHEYKYALQGAAMKLTPAQRAAMAKDSRVSYIVPDGIAKAVGTQTSPPWGLDRIDQANLPLNQTYNYPDQAGQGVNVYVIDTGINATHSDFSGRVGAGYDYVDGDSNPDDCNGHGTHVSGTIGGTTYGAAKKVTLHAVRVLDCGGSGTWANVISGIDWVRLNHSGASVANMSLSGSKNQAVNDAVTNAVAAGVTFAVAASNNYAADACSYSPASTPNALTVAATDNTDTRASFSNIGTCVDIFAPGVNILSSWIGSNSATNTISGTSMASPHVAGAAALYLGSSPSATPAQVAAALTGAATPGVVIDPGTGSPNLLLKTTTASTEPSWTLKYSWSGAAACAAGTATYASVPITLNGLPTASSGTFSIPTQSLTGQWAKVGSELQLRFDSTPCVYGGELLGKVSTGGQFNGSSTGCYYLYSGTALSVSLPEASSGVNAAGAKL